MVLEPKPIELIPIEIQPITFEISQHDRFLDSIGMRESSNRYDVVNGWGYFKFTYFDVPKKDIQTEVVSTMVEKIHMFKEGRGRVFTLLLAV